MLSPDLCAVILVTTRHCDALVKLKLNEMCLAPKFALHEHNY